MKPIAVAKTARYMLSASYLTDLYDVNIYTLLKYAKSEGVPVYRIGEIYFVGEGRALHPKAPLHHDTVKIVRLIHSFVKKKRSYTVYFALPPIPKRYIPAVRDIAGTVAEGVEIRNRTVTVRPTAKAKREKVGDLLAPFRIF